MCVYLCSLVFTRMRACMHVAQTPSSGSASSVTRTATTSAFSRVCHLEPAKRACQLEPAKAAAYSMQRIWFALRESARASENITHTHTTRTHARTHARTYAYTRAHTPRTRIHTHRKGGKEVGREGTGVREGGKEEGGKKERGRNSVWEARSRTDRNEGVRFTTHTKVLIFRAFALSGVKRGEGRIGVAPARALLLQRQGTSAERRARVLQRRRESECRRVGVSDGVSEGDQGPEKGKTRHNHRDDAPREMTRTIAPGLGPPAAQGVVCDPFSHPRRRPEHRRSCRLQRRR